MAAQDIDNIILRDTTQAPFTNKGDTLTYSELDSDFIVVGLFLSEMQAAIDVPSYSGATVYSTGDKVLYDSKYWVYLPAMSGTAVAPGTNPTVWELTTIGSLLHEKNQDSQLVGTSGTITADELISYTGLSFDLALDGTTGNGEVGYVDLVTPPTGTVVDTIKILTIDSDLTPDTATPNIAVVFTNGVDPDIELTSVLNVDEMNSSVKITQDATPNEMQSGYSIKLKVSGQDVSGNLKIKISYF